MIETALYNVLSGMPAIIAITTADRIYPAILPTEPTLPELTYAFVGGTVKPTMDTRGTQKSRVQLDCWGNSYPDAVTLRNAVIDSLAGYADANFSTQILQTIDFFEHEALQYRAVVEVYLFYAL
jgi:hypothetical protein